MSEKKEYEQIPSSPTQPSVVLDKISDPTFMHRICYLPSKIASRCLDFLFSEKFAKLLEKLTKNFYFWFLYLLCTVTEPILCAYYPTTPILIAQIFFLTINTCFFLIEIYGTVRSLRATWNSDSDEKNPTDDGTHENEDCFIRSLRKFSSTVKKQFWARFLFHCMYKSHGEHVLSFLCLLGGWVLIFIMPGVAILRCFRVFRMLWLYEKKLDGNFQKYLDKIHDAIGKDIIDTNYFAILGDLCEFSIKSLTALGSEMFRFTSKTRGGLFLMLVFFYFSYLFGAMFYVETGGKDWNDYCNSVGACMYIMMRLAFFDGAGLDFANDLGLNSRPILFFIAMVYMSICAFGLLNGLIGIFGTTFRFASRDAFKKGGKRARPPAPDESESDAADIGNTTQHLQRQTSPTPSVFTDFLYGEIFDSPELVVGPQSLNRASSSREAHLPAGLGARRPSLQRSSSAPVKATSYLTPEDQNMRSSSLFSGINPAAAAASSSGDLSAIQVSPSPKQGEGSSHELRISTVNIAACIREEVKESDGGGGGGSGGGGDAGAREGADSERSAAIRQLQDDVKELKRDMARVLLLLEQIADSADIDVGF